MTTCSAAERLELVARTTVPVATWVEDPYDIDGVPVDGVRAPLMLIALIPVGVFVALGGLVSMLAT